MKKREVGKRKQEVFAGQTDKKQKCTLLDALERVLGFGGEAAET